MKKDEFMKNIQECEILDNFDQGLLDQAAAMFEKWGLLAHGPGLWAKTDTEHLFDDFGLNDKVGDSDAVKRQKKALRCISSKMMNTQIRKEDAVGIMKNFNKIGKPGFRWLQ
ncbi:Uncharacterised protein [uncultured archaeon]|nr:Uncharacterised protein [uncultured archaeon]